VRDTYLNVKAVGRERPLAPVPDLTLISDINLNERVPLRRCAKALSVIASDIAIRPGTIVARSPGDHIPPGGFVLRIEMLMPIWSTFQPSSSTVWHLWTAFIPRRSITGKLLYGLVLRRHNGRRWIYKKFV
jgi:hypothetical protein